MTCYFLVAEPGPEPTGLVRFFSLIQVVEVLLSQFDVDFKQCLGIVRSSSLKELQMIAMSVSLSGQIDGRLKPTLNRYVGKISQDGFATELASRQAVRLAMEKLSQVPSKPLSILKLSKISRVESQSEKTKAQVKLPVIQKASSLIMITKRLTPSSSRLSMTLGATKDTRRSRIRLKALE